MNDTINKLTRRILEISAKHKLSHIGSCLSVLPILHEIYSIKKEEDLVILDNAHAHLSHLMFTNFDNADELIKKYGIHCDIEAGCDASGGSLGHAGGISIGLYLANRNRMIYTIFSDGSVQEGSVWEALRIRKLLNLTNMICFFNLNGYTAVAKIDIEELRVRILAFCPDAIIRLTSNGEGFDGVQGHYKTL